MRFEVAPPALGAKLAEVFPAILRHCRAKGVGVAGMPFARYLAHDEARGVFDVEAGLPVTADASGDGASELPGGPAATLVHVGPYEGLGDAHARLRRWVEAHRAAAGAPWEVYVTDPGTAPDPTKWRTDLFLPIR